MPFNTLRAISYYITSFSSVVPVRLQPLFITARAYAALPCRSRLRMTLLKDILKRGLKKNTLKHVLRRLRTALTM